MARTRPAIKESDECRAPGIVQRGGEMSPATPEQMM
jgi:hypothetical protein